MLSIAPLGNKIPTAINILHRCQTVIFAVGGMAELLHTILNNIFTNMLFGCSEKTVKVNGHSEVSHRPVPHHLSPF